MAFANGGKIITSGLVLSLDAADRNSYVSGSTTWRDLSGNNNTATLAFSGSSGALPTFNSTNGGTLVFNGSTSYCSIPNNSTLKPTTSITIEAFVNIVTISPSYQWVMRTGWAGSPYFFGINANGRYILTINDQAGMYNSVTAPLATIGDHHIVGTYNQSEIRMYIDGADSGFSYAYTTAISSNSLPVMIGGGDSTGNGIVDQQRWQQNNKIYNIKMYNRALSATEITQNYNAQKSRFNLT